MSFLEEIAKINPAELLNLPPEQIIDKFGGVDNARLMLKWCNYNHVYPDLARQRFMPFVKYTSPHAEHYQDPEFTAYDEQPHHTLVAEAIEEVFTGAIQYLAISMPPQTGKSELGTRKFIPYHVGKFPHKHILMGAYNQDFAEEFGDEVRNLIHTPEYQNVFPNVQLRAGSKAKDHMVTTAGGKISFLGRGGSATGRPADGFLMDDMIKDAKEAESKTTLDDIWKWFTRVANTRCHGKSWQIIIMTRWADDDPIGRLTDLRNRYYRKSVAAKWTVLNIPNIMTDEVIAKALGKKVGEALWENRFPLEMLLRSQAMDPWGFSALHMGKPTPPEGAFYKKSDIYTYDSIDDIPKNCRWYMSGDLAVSPDKNADRSCVGLWGLDEEDCLWLHPNLFWERIASDKTVDEIIERGIDHDIMEAFFEKGQIDKAIRPFLEKEMEYRNAYFGITAFPSAKNKGVRSVSMRGRMRQGKVKYPAQAHWWPDALDELLKFTGSGTDPNDDFADMAGLMGQALSVIITADAPPDESDNVIYPKELTWGWTKARSLISKRQQEIQKNRRGM